MPERYSPYSDPYRHEHGERHQSGEERSRRDDRGMIDRAGDEVRSWFGDDAAARRRRMDESRERWQAPDRWREERNYSSSRAYGDRDYGWRDDERWRDWPAQEYGRVSRSTHDEYGAPYSEYGRDTYGGPFARERFGAREWSSSERWRVPGPYTGRGPRGYRRSDQRIREDLCDRLTAHGLIDASDIECDVEHGEVTLRGFVDSRTAKRAAEDVAEDVDGVRDVHNEIRVRSHAAGEGVGRTSVPGVTATQMQTPATHTGTTEQSRTRS